MTPILRLVPGPIEEQPLRGLYLGLDLRAHRQPDRAFLYTTFVMSLDGRVSVGSMSGVPSEIANARDWRLFQELAIQADVVITSGEYARRLSAGKASPIITVYDDPDLEDLGSWRRDRGLPDYPAVAVVSQSLDFDPSDLGDAVVVTSGRANSERVRAIRQAGVRVWIAGDDAVDGGEMARLFGEDGLDTAFSGAGPRMLWTLFEGGVVDRLFLTLTDRILGGVEYEGLVEGPGFVTPIRMTLDSLYLDQENEPGPQQLFACYVPRVDDGLSRPDSP